MNSNKISPIKSSIRAELVKAQVKCNSMRYNIHMLMSVLSYAIILKNQPSNRLNMTLYGISILFRFSDWEFPTLTSLQATICFMIIRFTHTSSVPINLLQFFVFIFPNKFANSYFWKWSPLLAFILIHSTHFFSFNIIETIQIYCRILPINQDFS